MNAMRSPYFCFICRAMSTTGPHTRDWHSCGVANSSATGFLPRTSLKFVSCSSRANGRRVSIDARFPAALATVSVLMRGGVWPTSGILSLLFAVTVLARDVHGALAIDEVVGPVDHPEREPVLAGREDRRREADLRARLRQPGDLLERAAPGRREVGRGRRRRLREQRGEVLLGDPG